MDDPGRRDDHAGGPGGRNWLSLSVSVREHREVRAVKLHQPIELEGALSELEDVDLEVAQVEHGVREVDRAEEPAGLPRARARAT